MMQSRCDLGRNSRRLATTSSCCPTTTQRSNSRLQVGRRRRFVVHNRNYRDEQSGWPACVATWTSRCNELRVVTTGCCCGHHCGTVGVINRHDHWGRRSHCSTSAVGTNLHVWGIWGRVRNKRGAVGWWCVGHRNCWHQRTQCLGSLRLGRLGL